MRGKSSSRVRAMEVVERPSKMKEEPHLSGAYIRSLVKHLSSSRPKDQTMNPKSPNSTLEDRLDEAQLLQSPPPPPQHKKQVRRRLHTSRPYQERLLNMAEARKEIVTALKFHRAAMKQANEQQQQQHHHQLPSQPLEDLRRIPNPYPNIFQPNPPTFSNPNFSPFPHPSLSWSNPTLAPLPEISDDLNLPLPNQPLGLNLNFQGFNNIDMPLYSLSNIKDPPMQPLSLHSSPSCSYSYSSPLMCGMEVMEAAQTTSLGAYHTNMDHEDAKLHLAMDEKEMAEIRSIGEKHDIEWNDKVNLMTSAWWSKFLDTIEVDQTEGNGLHAFDEAIDIPAWLKDGSGGNANGSNLLMQHLDDYCVQDASLPW